MIGISSLNQRRILAQIKKEEEDKKLQEEQKLIEIKKIQHELSYGSIVTLQKKKEQKRKEIRQIQDALLDRSTVLEKMEIELIKYIVNIFNNMTENDNYSKKLLKIADESFIGTLLNTMLESNSYDFYQHLRQSDISSKIEDMLFKFKLINHLHDICRKKGVKLTLSHYRSTLDLYGQRQ
jgi:MFS superfamily sulfate permease-like transporter